MSNSPRLSMLRPSWNFPLVADPIELGGWMRDLPHKSLRLAQLWSASGRLPLVHHIAAPYWHERVLKKLSISTKRRLTSRAVPLRSASWAVGCPGVPQLTRSGGCAKALSELRRRERGAGEMAQWQGRIRAMSGQPAPRRIDNKAFITTLATQSLAARMQAYGKGERSSPPGPRTVPVSGFRDCTMERQCRSVRANSGNSDEEERLLTFSFEQFAHIYREYRPRTYFPSLHTIANSTEAEELTPEAFSGLFRNRACSKMSCPPGRFEVGQLVADQ